MQKVKFKAQITLTEKGKNCRRAPIFAGFRSNFCFNNDISIGAITLIHDKEKIEEGASAVCNVKLDKIVEIKSGEEFSIKIGNRIIGIGKILDI